MLRTITFTIRTHYLIKNIMICSNLSPSSLSLLATWQQMDKKFFCKYKKDKKAMEIIAWLAEFIATYDDKQKTTLFYC
jgi:hypothetical protein